MNTLEKELTDLVESYEGRLPLISGILTGSSSREEVGRLGAALYGEARSALQVKIPERLRLCPLEAGRARRVIWKLLEEESGNFDEGKDHASLIAITCRALGVPETQLESSYLQAVARLESLRKEETSLESTLRELTHTFVDEAILAREANNLGDALKRIYQIPEAALFYFRLHSTVDIEHSNALLEEIARYATTVKHRQLVLRVADDALANFPIWLA